MMLIKLNKLFTRGLFIGNIPGAPGTYGSLLALILLFFVPVLSESYLILVIFLLGVVSTNFEEKHLGIKDDSRIIIDEITGIFLTFYSLPQIYWIYITGFILFRVFDIFKPFWVKKIQNLPGGWGIMTDDLIAAIMANISLQLIHLIICIL